MQRGISSSFSPWRGLAGGGSDQGATAAFVAGQAILGTIGVFVQGAGTDALTTTWFRCALGLLALSLWLGVRAQPAPWRLPAGTAPRVMLVGVLMVLCWVLFFYAMAFIPTGVAVVLFHIHPLWMLAVGVLFWGEKVGRAYGLALAATFVGLALATGAAGALWGGGPPVSAASAWGVAACLLGSVLMAAVTLLAQRLQAVPACTLAWWQCALGAAVLWLWPLSQGTQVVGAAWAWLAALGVVHTGVAYGLIFAGMARLRPGRIAVYQFIYPLVALVVDTLVLGARLGPAQWGGVGLMVLAMVWAERLGPRAAHGDRAAG